MVYPRLTEVSGRRPPEDCGGPWGYAELIEAIKTPSMSASRSSEPKLICKHLEKLYSKEAQSSAVLQQAFRR